MGDKKKWIWVPAAVGLVLFLYFVFPTPYIYVHPQPGAVRQDVSRVHRFTGVEQFATDRGWRTQTEVQAEVYSGEKRKLTAALEAGQIVKFRVASGDLQVMFKGSEIFERVMPEKYAEDSIADLSRRKIPEDLAFNSGR